MADKSGEKKYPRLRKWQKEKEQGRDGQTELIHTLQGNEHYGEIGTIFPCLS